MKDITKENINEFLDYYHGFHDSYVLSINYDIENSKIEMLIDTCWSGNPTIKEDGTYETNRTKVKINFEHINECNIKDISSFEYIDDAYLKYVIINDKELICFASNENEPLFYIVAERMEYEEIKNK